ncbi:adenylosuccinate lyase [Spiroplasma citri]|uniref:Adenylosuccinate lyase n=1 Tax=Spiroplasma citri TaxID=2133 RepID=A0AAJ4EI76_SPICI|nr:adenylosuccinate lyase [Spiroplasma citri]APE74186.1 adenylosuccinate lyase [Spiroplasma citri]QED24156.1 adenylosuccinate lyase [Spiroplasma citri]QIA66434.1 adenylosuccinate lyase [Spiroplasma citri]QIA68312.1 adenylosuccinate lyase [Spiroplasma citri]QIA70189.1 adenylosuccinate lyase [Spiroplasma citri]
MIERYFVTEIGKIWSDENKYNTWAKVELLVCEGWAQIGLIPPTDIEKIKTNLTVNLPRMLELEAETKHDVVAFTRMLSETLGPEKKWIHYGLTSTDIVDTSQNYLMKESNHIVAKYLFELKTALKEKALAYKNQLIMGRTHGMFAEPTSLGLKFLLWYAELERNMMQFEAAGSAIAVAKISGSVGNYAHVEVQVEEYVAKQLGLNLDPITTQVTSRDYHIALFTSFSKIASLLEKMALEFRHLQRSEVGEIAEGFSKSQKGSSSMPHKKNPISAENIAGLARLIRSNMNVTFENNLLWHERDISHSSNERIIIPDTYHLVVYLLKRMIGVINNLVVSPDKIIEHLQQTNQIYFSQVVLTNILKETNYSREEIYDFIQKCTLIAQQQQLDFKNVLIDNNVAKYLSLPKLEQLFDNNYFLRNIEQIYHRVLK